MSAVVCSPEIDEILFELTQPSGRDDPYPRYEVSRRKAPLALAPDGVPVATLLCRLRRCPARPSRPRTVNSDVPTRFCWRLRTDLPDRWVDSLRHRLPECPLAVASHPSSAAGNQEQPEYGKRRSGAVFDEAQRRLPRQLMDGLRSRAISSTMRAIRPDDRAEGAAHHMAGHNAFVTGDHHDIVKRRDQLWERVRILIFTPGEAVEAIHAQQS